MRWPLARAQVKHRKWCCTQFLKSELQSIIESKASLYTHVLAVTTSAKLPIYTHTHVYALHTFPLLICNP
jgi:hypothetical protein